ncbi:MAG: hypothetical protein ACLPY1_02160 [Terracidiphilus sp.]
MITELRTARQSTPGSRCVYIHAGFALLLALLIGCANSEKLAIGSIQFVTLSGAPLPPVSTLDVNGTIYLVATVTNDNEELGVTWTVNCGSLPPVSGTNDTISTVCGICSPAVTFSGPVPTYPATGFITTFTAPSAIPKGNTVTITAHATSLQSVTSSVALTIEPAGQAASPAIPRPTERFSNSAQRAGF